jgi:hypothetical protein
MIQIWSVPKSNVSVSVLGTENTRNYQELQNLDL